LKEKVILLPSINAKPDDSHCSIINFVIKTGLLLLSIKNGSDKFKVGFESEGDEANNGIIKKILSSLNNFIKLHNSSTDNPSKL
jgi:hypothetical protein